LHFESGTGQVFQKKTVERLQKEPKFATRRYRQSETFRSKTDAIDLIKVLVKGRTELVDDIGHLVCQAFALLLELFKEFLLTGKE